MNVPEQRIAALKPAVLANSTSLYSSLRATVLPSGPSVRDIHGARC